MSDTQEPVNPAAGMTHEGDGAELGAEPQPAEAVAPAEPGLSRKAAWLAMGAVTLALLLIWLAPGIDHVDESVSATSPGGGSPGEPEDAAFAGKPANLAFKLKDMNGVEVRLDSFNGVYDESLLPTVTERLRLDLDVLAAGRGGNP